MGRAIRICAVPFATLFAVSASAASVSWTGATDAVWSTGGDWVEGVAQTDSGMAVFDAGSVAGLSTAIGFDASIQSLKVTTMDGLITIGGANALTLGAGGMSMIGTSRILALDALLALAVEQSCNEETGLALMTKGLIRGVEVNLSKIDLGDLAFNGANISVAPMTIGNEALSGRMSATSGTKLALTDFGTLSFGPSPRLSPKVDAMKIYNGSGVVQSASHGRKRTVKITVRGAGKAGADVKPMISGRMEEDFREALELPRSTGPLFAQNGNEGRALSEARSINTDASNVTLSETSIRPVIHQSEGRQFTTVKLVPLVSPPTLTGTSISITFGNGTQNGNGSGPGAISNFWNNINTTPWDGGGHPYGTNGNGNGPFSSDTPTAIGIKNSNGITLGTPVTIRSFDAGQQAAINNNGAYGGWGSTGTGASIGLGTNPYDQQFALFQTSANSTPANTNCTLTFSNIPFATYNAYVGGKNLYQGAIYGVGTQINGAATFVDQSGSTFQLVAAWGHPYDGLGGKISYLQFVNTTFYWKGATNGSWAGSPTNFTSDLAGTQAETGALTSDVHVVFNANGAANFANTTLGGNQTIKSLTFGANATSAVGIGGSDTLTIAPSSPTTGVTVANLSGNHVISSKVALGANQTWTVTSASQILTASGEISGGFGLTKAGSGTLVFTGANTYSGATTISTGKLQLGNGGTTGSISNLSTVTGTGTLAINRSNTATQGTDFGLIAGGSGLTQTGAGTTILNAANTYTGPTIVSTGTLQFGDGGNSGSISTLSSLTNNSTLVVNRSNIAIQGADFGVIAGSGLFIQAGSGTTILNLANTFTGATRISGGTLSVGADAFLGNANALILDGGTLQITGTALTSYSAGLIGTHAVTLTPNKTVSFDISNAANVFTVGQVLNQGAGGLTKSGFGTLVLAGANTYSGTTTVNGGTLIMAGSPVGTAAMTAINGGLLKLDYGTNNTSKIDDAEVLTLGGGTLEMSGGSHVEIVGTMTVAAGFSEVTRSSGTAVIRMISLVNNAGGKIDFATNDIASTSTPNDASGILGAWATVGGADWASNSGISEGGGNNFIRAYTGYTDIAARGVTISSGLGGNLRINSAGSGGNNALSTTTTTINTLMQNTGTPSTVETAGKTLRVNGIMLSAAAESLTIGAAANDGLLTSATSSGTPDLRIINHSASKVLTIHSVIADNTVASTLNKSGIGTLVLSGINTYTGATMVSGGTLSVGEDANLGNANPLIIDGGGLQITGTALTSYAAGLIGSHAVTLTPGKTVGFDISDAANIFTISEVLNLGTAGVTKAGAGTLVLTGANTFVGAMTISGGTLSVGVDTNLGNANPLVIDGGSLQITGTSLTSYAAGLIGSHAVTLTTGKTVGFDINDSENTFTVSQILNLGAGGVTKAGAGTLALTAANNYSGATTLNAGTLRLGTSTAIGTGTLVINGGSLDNSVANLINANNNPQSWNGSFAYVGTNSLDLGTGAVVMSTTPTVTVGAGTLSVGGGISGAGFGLTKAGPGTLVLSGTNSFTGATTLSSGTLIVGTDANLGIANALIFDGGTLQVTGITLNNFASHTVTFNAGKSVALDIANAANTLTVSEDMNQAAGGLTKSGPGTLVLSGTNTFTGETTLNDGTLSVGTIGDGGFASNLGAASNSASNLVFNGGALRYTGVSSSTDRNFTINAGKTATFNITQAGANLTVSGAAPATTGGLAKTGAGRLTFVNSQAYTGATNVNGGSLQIGDGGTLPTLTTSGITLANGGNLTFNHSDEVTYKNVITGTGSFTKAGTGTLTLLKAQTYTGATVVEDGILRLQGTPLLPVTAGLQYQLDASNADSLVFSAGANVSQWKDLSGNNRNFTTSIGAPVFLQNVFGTRPGIDFGGPASGDVLRGAAGVNAQTVIIVNKPTAYSDLGAIWGGENADKSIRMDFFGSQVWRGRPANPSDGGDSNDYNNINGANGSTWITTATTFDVNNTSFGPIGTPHILVMTGNYTPGMTVIGGGAQGNRHYQGDIGEVLVFNTQLSQADRQAVELYLQIKWLSGGGGGANTLPITTDLTLGATALLDLGGTDQQIASLTAPAGASITNGLTNIANQSILTISGTASTTFGGVIGDGGATKRIGLVKSGSGTQTLTGINTYTGPTNINGGILAIGADGSLASSAISIGGGGTLDVSARNASTFAVPAGTTFTNNGVVRGNLIAPAGTTLGGAGSYLQAGTGPFSVTLAGSTIQPGNGSGTVTVGVGGSPVNFALQDDSTFRWGATSASTAGLIQITGDLSVGTNVKIIPLNLGYNFASGDSYTIMTWTGTDPVNAPILGQQPPTISTGTWSGADAVDPVLWDRPLNWDGIYQELSGGIIQKVGKSFVASNFTYSPTIPGEYTDVVIAPTGGVAVTGPSLSTTVKSVILGNGIDSTSLTFQSSGSLTVKTTTVLKDNSTLVGPGTLQVPNINTLSGTVKLDGVVLQAAANSTDFVTGGASLALKAGGVGMDTNGYAVTFTKTLGHDAALGAALDGGLTKSGSGSLTITNAQTYTGTTTVGAGVLQIGNGGTTGALGVGSVLNNASLVFNRSDTNTVSNNIGGSGALTQNSTGTLILSGANTYTGATTLSAGTLSVGAAQNLGGANSLVFDGGTLQVTGTSLNTFENHAPVFNNGRNVAFDINNAANTFTVSQVLNQGTGSLTKTGAGTLALNAANTFSGVTTINAGSINMGHNQALQNSTVSAGSANNSLIFSPSITTPSLGALKGGGNLTLTTSASEPVTLTAGSNGDTTTFSGVLSGAGGFTKSGSGTLTIARTQTYTGPTVIKDGGVLKLAGSAYPVTGLLGKWTFDDGDASDSSGYGYNGTTAVGTPVYSADDTHDGLGRALVLNGSSAVKVDTGGSQSVFDGGTSMTISAWVKGWPGAWAPFVGKNGESNGWQMRKNHTGQRLDWTARGLNSNGGSDFTSNTTVVANGQWHMVTMTYDGTARKTYVDGVLDSTRNNTETIAPSTSMLMFGARDNGTLSAFFNGKLDDIYFYNRALTAGEISNAYGGLSGLGSNVLPITTTLSVDAGSTFDLNGINQQIAALSNSGGAGGTVSNTSTTDVTLTISGAATATYSGVISDGATNKITLVKSGPGTQSLAGANTYTGATLINEGTLQLGDGGTSGSISLQSAITSDGTFAVNRSNTTTQGVDFDLITGSGGFTQAGSGTTILNLTNTYIGVTTVNAGTLVVNGSLSGSTVVNSGGTLEGSNVAMGEVTVNSGGTLAPGVGGTGALNTGTLTFAAGSVFNFQIDTSTPDIDIVSVTGDLNIGSGVIFNASNLGSALLDEGFPVPAIIDYSGTWNGGTFVGLADDSIFMIGANAYQISYNGLDGASSEVTLSVVPEPGVAISLLGGLGLLLGVRRRRE